MASMTRKVNSVLAPALIRISRISEKLIYSTKKDSRQYMAAMLKIYLLKLKKPIVPIEGDILRF